ITKAIRSDFSPPVISHYEIKPALIGLVQKSTFSGLTSDIPIDHIEAFERICNFSRSNGTSMIKFVQKDFAEMFPRWDFDVEDPAVENIIKVMFNAKANWKKTMDCWEFTGTKPRVKKEVSAAETKSGVKEESVRPQKKVRKEASVKAKAYVEASQVPSAKASTSVGGMTKKQIEKSFGNIDDVMRDGFGTCLKEIKVLGDKIGAVEKKVGITKKGTASNELQLKTSNPEKHVHEPGSESVNGAKAGHNDPQKPSSSKDRSLVIANEYKGVPTEGKPTEQSDEPSVFVLDKGVPTDSDLQKEETRRHRKKDVAMLHVRGKSERARKLAASQQTPFKGNITAKVIIPNKRVGQGYDPFAPVDKKMSKVLTDWVKLDPCPTYDAFINVLKQQYQDNPHQSRSERLCFLDHVFSRQWSHKYPEFKSDEDDINGLGRRLPGGAWNYHAGIVPSFYQSMKVLGLDVDDIYAPVNFRNEHWIAIWISIPKKHIVVWDSIISHIRAAELDEFMEPFVTMVPYLLVEYAGSDEERVQHTLEPYTYERVAVGIPQCRAGDCGVFALKYIECHALGMSFPPEFCTKNERLLGRRWRWIYLRRFLKAIQKRMKTMMRTWELM
ncbi:unnamed protein product, partial [Brassica rapa subsp. narinosa]